MIYELSPGIYTIKDISEAVYTMGDHKGTQQIESDDFSMKKIYIDSFWRNIWKIKVFEKPFFNTLLGFTLYWNYKSTKAIHVDFPGVYTSDKSLNLKTVDKTRLKCDVIDGSVVKVPRQPIFLSFVLDEPSGYKVFCEPDTILHKK